MYVGTKCKTQYFFRVCFVKCDVSSKADWDKLWASAERELEGKIELICNNAGVAATVKLIRNHVQPYV
jgi:NAD(P)-dependent dehydrogenase (short-subunit alcohol dehydrogenase family)